MGAYRLAFFFGRVPAVEGPVRTPNRSLVAWVTAVFDWRLTAAVIRPRAELATELALLSHMLMNGFFFSQGLEIANSCLMAAPQP